MSKKKREKMKAKQRRHGSLAASAERTASSSASGPAGNPPQRPTRSSRQRKPKRWLGLTSQQWLWIGLAVIVVVVAGVLVWWFTRQPSPAAVPTPTPVSVPTVLSEGDRPMASIAPDDRVNYYSSPPEMKIDPSKQYQATLHTEKGDIVIELYADKVPQTVNHFVSLSNDGYYDGTTFHRVIPGFMAQAGDPSGTGTGGPGYTFDDEFHPDLRHDGAGVVSMANSGANTNGGQFFITYAAQPHLDDAHAVFGKVI